MCSYSKANIRFWQGAVFRHVTEVNENYNDGTMSTPRSRRIPQSMSIRFAHDKTVTPARTKRDDHAVALQHCCQDPADEHVRFTQTDKRTVKKIRSCLFLFDSSHFSP